MYTPSPQPIHVQPMPILLLVTTRSRSHRHKCRHRRCRRYGRSSSGCCCRGRSLSGGSLSSSSLSGSSVGSVGRWRVEVLPTGGDFGREIESRAFQRTEVKHNVVVRGLRTTGSCSELEGSLNSTASEEELSTFRSAAIHVFVFDAMSYFGG